MPHIQNMLYVDCVQVFAKYFKITHFWAVILIMWSHTLYTLYLIPYLILAQLSSTAFKSMLTSQMGKSWSVKLIYQLANVCKISVHNKHSPKAACCHCSRIPGFCCGPVPHCMRALLMHHLTAWVVASKWVIRICPLMSTCESFSWGYFGGQHFHFKFRKSFSFAEQMGNGYFCCGQRTAIVRRNTPWGVCGSAGFLMELI